MIYTIFIHLFFILEVEDGGIKMKWINNIKKIMILCLIVMFLFGCQNQNRKDDLLPFDLFERRIQVSQNEEIDYLSYINGSQDVKRKLRYNQIDTSKIGTYLIHYHLEDKYTKAVDQNLIVDVVKMYDGSIFNPEGIEPEIVDNPNDISVLVNKTHCLSEDYQPDDLVDLINSHQQLRKEAADAYQKLYQDATNQGIKLYAISGYRSYETQENYWQRQVLYKGEEYASLYSAYPGRSEHQTGLALDISYQQTGDRLNEDVADSDIGKFIKNEGYKYGFILRYPKDKTKITNYAYEPWHIRYVGIDLATKLYQNQMTLEEYYEKI